MSGKNTGHKCVERTSEGRISILNCGRDLCGWVNSEKHTNTRIPHTDSGDLSKKALSQLKVSLQSEVSQAERPDTETNTAWHRGKETSI